MSEITKPLVLDETFQELNEKIDTMNGHLESIASNLSPELIEMLVTNNGTYFASDDNADGYSKVVVNVPQSTPTLITKSITANGTYAASSDNADGYSSVTVNVMGGATKNDVNFYDYDGTRIASYSKTDFLALTAMPANPSHSGLTAQGWNWSLADAKTYVTNNDELDIGQAYVTDDGKTRIYVHMDAGRLQPQINVCLFGECEIDWGDGSEPDTISFIPKSITRLELRSATHTYNNDGDYVITLDPTEGTIGFGGSSYSLLTKQGWYQSGEDVYATSIRKVEIGNSFALSGNAFYNCTSLSSITIPNTVKFDVNDSYHFYGCKSLSFVVLPDNSDNVESDEALTGIPYGMFDECAALISVIMPVCVEYISSCFYHCRSLVRIVIPPSVTIVNNMYGNDDCFNIQSVIIPSGCETIGGDAFQYCTSLNSVKIPNSTNSLASNAFAYCSSLTSVEIGSGIQQISDYAFDECTSLASIIFPSAITSIGSCAFSSCSGLGFIRFNPTIPPTVESDSFDNLPTDCIISVPNGSYLSAENYPDPNTYNYIVDGR